MMSSNCEDKHSLLVSKNSREISASIEVVRNDTVLTHTAQSRSQASSFKSKAPLPDHALNEQYLDSNSAHTDTNKILGHECSSNQSGSDSGLGNTNSFSSDNNSYIVFAPNAQVKIAQATSKAGSEQSIQNQVGSTDKSWTGTINSKDNTDPITSNDTNLASMKTTIILSSPSSKSTDNERLQSNNDLNNNCDNRTSVSPNRAASTSKINSDRNQGSHIECEHPFPHTSVLARTSHKPYVAQQTHTIDKVANQQQSNAPAKLITNVRAYDHDCIKPDEVGDYDRTINDDFDIGEICVDDHVAPADQSSDLSTNIKQNESMSPQSHSPMVKSSDGPVLRSALKKVSNHKVIGSNKSKSISRNVTFNQTVIVFCEEIETSTPGDCDPPTGYDDVDTVNTKVEMRSDEKESFDEDRKIASSGELDRKDLSPLSKFVGQDASKLTDEQLFALLDDNELLNNIKLDCDVYSDDEEITVGRTSSNQDCLYRDTISDSDASESSTGSCEIRANKTPSPTRLQETTCAENSHLAIDERRLPGKLKTPSGTIVQAKSLPARMKVSMVDCNSSKRRTSSSTQDDTQRQNLRQQIKINGQFNEDPTIKSIVKQTKNDPTILSHSIIGKGNIPDSVSSSNYMHQVPTDRRAVAQATYCQPKHHLPGLPTQSPVKQQASEVTTQYNPTNIAPQTACHVCRAMESNQGQSVGKQSHNFLHNQPVTSNFQTGKPLACQIVYVVDQHGNRVRALQVVGPSVNQKGVIPRHFILAPTNNQPSNLNGLPVTQRAMFNPSHVAQISQATNRQGPSQLHMGPRVLNPVVPPSAAGGSFGDLQRQHTVYYVRQPLGIQNTRQSFPDPHEIRRLDGLRGPTNNIDLSQREDYSRGTANNLCATKENNPQRKINDQYDADDPTFGFSNRPTVKVFQANRNHHNGANVDPFQQGNRAVLPLIQKQGNAADKISLAQGSQTLDRRNVRNQLTQAGPVKRNIIPGTSSMSNINRSALLDPKHSFQQGIDNNSLNMRDRHPINSSQTLIQIRSNEVRQRMQPGALNFNPVLSIANARLHENEIEKNNNHTTKS